MGGRNGNSYSHKEGEGGRLRGCRGGKEAFKPQTWNPKSGIPKPLSPNLEANVGGHSEAAHRQVPAEALGVAAVRCTRSPLVGKEPEGTPRIVMGLYWGYNIRIMENKMETTIYWGNIGSPKL